MQREARYIDNAPRPGRGTPDEVIVDYWQNASANVVLHRYQVPPRLLYPEVRLPPDISNASWEWMKLSTEELELAKTPGFLAVKGRSGTGKTLLILHRMLLKASQARRAHLACRQVFVARNQRLCTRARDDFPRQYCNATGHVSTHFFTTEKLVQHLEAQVTPQPDQPLPRWAMEAKQMRFGMFESWYSKRKPPSSSSKANGLGARQVWTEIQSIIQGGVGVVCTGNMLTRKNYLTSNNVWTQWTKLSDTDRVHVFHTYEEYCRHREKLGFWDVGQRNLTLLTRLRRVPGEAWRSGQCPFDHISVDEVQDMTAVEVAIALCACGNQPQHLTLCGDEIQQVTPGIVFRFEAIREVVYAMKKKGVPRPKQLFRNYRSHDGILRLGTAVIELLRLNFGVDNMSGKQTAVVSGPTPRFARLTTAAALQDAVSNSDVQLLFVDKVSRDDFLSQSEDLRGASMTVKSAKGLEWDHVCLVNVFSSLSKVDGASKALRHMLSVKTHGPIRNCPGLEYLLKALYVGITRCKSRLTLVEVVGKSSRAAVETVNLVSAWMQRTGIVTTNTSPLRLGGNHSPAQRVADACDIMWRLENSPDEDRDTLVQWVDNARRGFSVGGRTDLARAAHCHLRLVLSIRDTPVLSNDIYTPLTDDHQEWETKMAGLATDCLDVGLICQVRSTMGSASMYVMQAMQQHRQRMLHQRSQFNHQLLNMDVNEDTLDAAVQSALDRLQKLQKLQSLRDDIVSNEVFFGLMGDKIT